MNEPMSSWTDQQPPSLEDVAQLASEAFAALPDKFRRMAGDVAIHIHDFPDPDVLDELGIEDPFELTGLYQGPDLRRRSFFDPAPQQSMVFLYRRPILDEWAERGDVTLGELVSHVLVHEIGHHFGLSDADIESIEGSV
jgi:predicted Zn-dependent protease with MMP-like domain